MRRRPEVPAVRETAGEVVRARLAAGDHVPRWETPNRAARRRPEGVTVRRRDRRSKTLLWPVRIGVAVVSCAAIALSGLVWAETHHLVDGFTVSSALGADAPHSSGGAENILLMGLDTRKDLNGQDLPADILEELHAGDSSDGGYNAHAPRAPSP
ncbi:hypothetical protein [Gordonia neofelifaecis]|uniref:Cell envelope-related transcriptional attenuator n=1 Tax=Gordonia neofelifaecis NRRL B-59395 TaxID=644548 RepID=F1YN22_9ACTN|nr:hypothetical protein [Gordonia neofelifaecis]EGD53909.1 cell envelope-related transcriptional attenuator [Gordonia neofelifaecis NRRL B-59395]